VSIQKRQLWRGATAVQGSTAKIDCLNSRILLLQKCLYQLCLFLLFFAASENFATAEKVYPGKKNHTFLAVIRVNPF